MHRARSTSAASVCAAVLTWALEARAQPVTMVFRAARVAHAAMVSARPRGATFESPGVLPAATRRRAGGSSVTAQSGAPREEPLSVARIPLGRAVAVRNETRERLARATFAPRAARATSPAAPRSWIDRMRGSLPLRYVPSLVPRARWTGSWIAIEGVSLGLSGSF